jgi:hypothetical protein
MPGYTPLTLAKLWQHTHGMANTLSYFVPPSVTKKTCTFKGCVLTFGTAAVLSSIMKDVLTQQDLVSK